MSRALLSEILRTMRKTKSRFISIILIMALGTGVFVGVKAAVPDMQELVEEYFLDTNLLDLRVVSTIGLTDDDVEAIAAVDGVNSVMGSKYVDALVYVNGEIEYDIDGSQISTRAYGVSIDSLKEYFYGANDSSFINRPQLIEGSYPTAANECLVDESQLSTPDSFTIGSTITLVDDDGDAVDGLSVTEFTVVGIIRSSYYISYERGNTTIGSGKVGTFIIIPDSAFTTDYYSEIYITVDDADNYSPLSDEYDAIVESVADSIEAISDNLLTTRVEYLASTLPDEIAEAESEYNSAYAEYMDALAEAQEAIDLYQYYVDDPDGAYEEAVKEFAETYGLAYDEYSGSLSEYYAAVEEYNELLNEYNESYAALKEYAQTLEDAESDYNTMYNQITSLQSTIATLSSTIEQINSLITTTQSVLNQLAEYESDAVSSDQISSILAILQNTYPEIYNAVSSLSTAGIATMAASLLNEELVTYSANLASTQEDLEEAEAALATAQEELAAFAAALETATEEYNQKYAELEAASEALQEFYDELELSNSSLTLAQVQLMISQSSGESSLESIQIIISNAATYLAQAQATYDALVDEYGTELAEALQEINSAKKLLESLDSATVSVYDRDDTPGYTNFKSMLNVVSTVGNVVSIVFYLIAALVCLTTMLRMVHEERTLMGTLKALGYSKRSIYAKYVIYAAFACIIGSSVGSVVGLYLFPLAFYEAYSIMFSFPDLVYLVPYNYIAIGILISLVLTVAVTLLASRSQLSERPSSLMRPKAPKPGKRTLLDHITPLWKRISFFGKVTARNISRNLGRVIVTTISFIGCMALVLGCMGFYTSLSQIMSKQFDEETGIFSYDYQVLCDYAQDPDNSVVIGTMAQDSRVGSIMLVSMKSATGTADESDTEMDVYVLVPHTASALGSFITLQDRKSGEQLELGDDGAIISEQFANRVGVSVGDTIYVEFADGTSGYIPVAGICENYVFQYVYISSSLYQEIFGDEPEYNYAIGTFSDEVTTDNEKSQFATDFMEYDSITTVVFLSSTIETFEEIVNILSFVMGIFIIGAAILCFVVMNNISNMNISERTRELSTLKVLGFSNKELKRYVERENIVILIFGLIFGVFGGIGLHKLLINVVTIDTIMFGQTIAWYAYVIAIAFMILVNIIVNFLMSKKISRIDMIASLKSVE